MRRCVCMSACVGMTFNRQRATSNLVAHIQSSSLLIFIDYTLFLIVIAAIIEQIYLYSVSIRPVSQLNLVSVLG